MGWMILVSIVGLLLLNIPIGFAIGIASVIIIILANPDAIGATPQIIFAGLNSFPLMAIPLFVLAGELMNTGGITQRMVDFANCLVGRLRGGLAYVTIIAAMVMAGVSGSAVADTAALGAVLIPAMYVSGINKAYAAALVSVAGTIGIIIPPSVPMVLFGVSTNASIGSLFLAGIIPGILVGLSLTIITYFYARKNNIAKGEPFSFERTWKTFIESLPALIMPFIIVGGILSGIVTPTESAVIAVVYGLIVGKLYYKELTFSKIPDVFLETAKQTAIVMIMVGTSQLLGWVLTYEDIPQKITSFVSGLAMNKFILFFILDLILILAGTILHGPAMIIVLAPIMLPIVTSLGLDPVQFGVIFVLAVAIGGITPPVAASLFVTSSIADMPIGKIFKASISMIIAMFLIMLLVTYIPAISMYIPQTFFAP